MIAYIRGILAEKEPTRAVVEAGGVGYELFIPLSTYDRLPRQGEEAKLLAAHVVRDDAEALFGFATAEEREMFTMLVSVSGVGPKIALSMLSGTSLGDLAQAIAGGDVKRISSIRTTAAPPPLVGPAVRRTPISLPAAPAGSSAV